METEQEKTKITLSDALENKESFELYQFEIAKLGRSNLLGLLRIVLGKIKESNYFIKRQADRIAFIKKITPETLRQGYSDPNIPQEDIEDGHPIRLPDLLRKSGTTDYYNCSWCSHNYSQAPNNNFSYKNSRKCSWISLAENEPFSTSYGFNQKCKFIELLETKRDSVIANITTRSLLSKTNEEEILKDWGYMLKHLYDPIPTSVEGVLLSELRVRNKEDHFSKNENIMFYAVKRDEFLNAQIYETYRKGNFCFYSEEPFYGSWDGGMHPSGRIGHGHESIYRFLKLPEFDFLKTNQDYTKNWLAFVRQSEGDKELFEKFAEKLLSS